MTGQSDPDLTGSGTTKGALALRLPTVTTPLQKKRTDALKTIKSRFRGVSGDRKPDQGSRAGCAPITSQPAPCRRLGFTASPQENISSFQVTIDKLMKWPCMCTNWLYLSNEAFKHQGFYSWAVLQVLWSIRNAPISSPSSIEIRHLDARHRHAAGGLPDIVRGLYPIFRRHLASICYIQSARQINTQREHLPAVACKLAELQHNQGISHDN